MLIKSKFHDYYDTALMHGVDKSIVYVRNTQPREAVDRIEMLKFFLTEKEVNMFEHAYHLTPKMRVMWVVAAGKFYPVVCISSEYDPDPVTKSAQYFASKQSMEKHVNYDRFVEHAARSKAYGWMYFYRDRHKSAMGDVRVNTILDDLFSLSGKDVTQQAVARNIVISAYGRSSDIDFYDSYPDNGRFFEIKNPCLKNFSLQSAVDPFTMAQDIMMWISGVLGSPAGEMVEISDKNRFEAHGFDQKYGFRTRPK